MGMSSFEDGRIELTKIIGTYNVDFMFEVDNISVWDDYILARVIYQ